MEAESKSISAIANAGSLTTICSLDPREGVDMHSQLKLAFAAAILCGTAAASPSSAESWNYVSPGYYDQPYYLSKRDYCRAYRGYYNSYQGPDGTYGSLADYVRSVRGIPCGIECTRDAQARWAQYYCNPSFCRVPRQ
jgi:hypothetical protein